MDSERALVSKVAQTGKGCAELVAEGLSEQHFTYQDEDGEDVLSDCGEVWKFIVGHTNKYGRQPSYKTIIEHFPKFDFEPSSEPLEYLKDRLVADIERRRAADIALEIAAACSAERDAGGFAELLLERGRELRTILPSKPPARLSDAHKRIAVYKERAAIGDPFAGKIKLDIPELDEAIMGVDKNELVTIVGWTGLGKSTLTQWLMLNFYNQGKRGVFVSLEMPAEALMQKWDQMIQQFTSYKHLRALNLTEAEIERWIAWGDKAKESEADIIVLGGGGSEWSVERVHSEIVHHQPDVIAIDYITLMSMSSTREQRWEQVSKIAQRLKDVAMQTECPIFAVAQTGRESAKVGAELDNVAASVGIVNASDIVIGLHQDEERRHDKLMEVRLIKNRYGQQLRTDVYWDMEHMRFADSFMAEQVRKMRAEEKPKAVEEEPQTKPVHVLGRAAVVDMRTGEIRE